MFICHKRFVNARARGKLELLRHFHQSKSSSNQALLIKQIWAKFLEFSIDHRSFSKCYDFKNPDNVICEFIDTVSANLGSREGEFRLICCIVNQSLPQLEGKSLCTNSCFTTGIIQDRLAGRVKDHLFSNTIKKAVVQRYSVKKVFLEISQIFWNF